MLFFLKKNKKYILINSFILLLLLLVIVISPLRNYNQYFTSKDSASDDFGNGSISYPAYITNLGVFDILSFNVKNAKESAYSFEFKMATIDNNSRSLNKFSNLVLDVYISLDSSGSTRPSHYGLGVKFDENNPWNYHLKITPDEAYFEIFEAKVGSESIKAPVEVTIESNTIKANINKSDLKGDLLNAKYYAMSSGYDIFGPDKYRQVQKDGEEIYFSGGVDSLYQPNVIDMVHPAQKDILNRFMPPNFTTIYPVENSNFQKFFVKEYLLVFVILWFLISTSVSLFKYKKNK